ncbi:MAG: hypothetical protein V4547_13595, partial [Bacteroidota bacterium]
MQKVTMDRVETESFTVTLQSNLCRDEFPHNTNYLFKNRLPHDVNVEKFEVGLVDLYHYDTYQRPPNKDEIQLRNKANIPFFDLLFSENEMVVLDSSSSNLHISKYSDSISQWLIKVNRDLQSQNMRTHISAILDTGILKRVIIEFTPPDESKLILSEPLKRVLGFHSPVLESGSHTSDTEVDLEFFKSLALLQSMGYLRRELLSSDTVTIPQIHGRPNIDDFLVDIVLAFTLKGHEISLTHENRVVEYSITPQSKRILFSKFVNNWLGLPDNFYFQGDGTINIPEEIVDPEGKEKLLLDSVYQTSSKIVVSTDI